MGGGLRLLELGVEKHSWENLNLKLKKMAEKQTQY